MVGSYHSVFVPENMRQFSFSSFLMVKFVGCTYGLDGDKTKVWIAYSEGIERPSLLKRLAR
eukprot:463492-Amphidinium_carterae.1